MSTDSWLTPDIRAVKLTAFEQLARQVTEAASTMDCLYGSLSSALTRAGVGSGPASDIKQIAAWARRAGPELQRQVEFARDLDRHKLAVSVSRADGTYLMVPDRPQDQLGQLNGREAAKLLQTAATGNRSALQSLANLTDDATNPYFAQALLQALGAPGLIDISAGLAHQLHLDQTAADRQSELAADPEHLRAMLRMLAGALAVGTDPARPVPIGEAFLQQLQEAGRAQRPVLGAGSADLIVGYRTLATILESLSDATPLPPQFFQTVGRDMIAFDRETVASYQGLLPSPVDQTDILRPLLDAAQTTESARALLDHAPPGQPDSNLCYLLHDRAQIWSLTDHGASLGGLLVRAMSAADLVSTRLLKETGQILGADIREYLSYGEDNLQLDTTGGKSDLLSGLRPFLGELLRVHLDALDTAIFGVHLFGVDGKTTGPTMRDTDALLAEVSRDEQAFDALVSDEIGRTRALLDRQYKMGEDIDDILLTQGALLGHLLAMRRETLLAAGEHADGSNQELADLISKGIGVIPVPYGHLFCGAPTAVHDTAATTGYGKVGDWLKTQIQQYGGPAQPDRQLSSDGRNVLDLFRQMALSAAVAHINSAGKPVVEQVPFASGGHILPLTEWADDPAKVDAFETWCEEHNVPVPRMSAQAENAILSSNEEALNSFFLRRSAP